MAIKFRRAQAIADLFLVFAIELYKANRDVFLAVLSGTNLKPAIVVVPTDLESDWEILLLANMITLTPGTLTLDVSSNRRELFVHVFHTDDPNSVIASIKNAFESRIRKAFQKGI